MDGDDLEDMIKAMIEICIDARERGEKTRSVNTVDEH